MNYFNMLQSLETPEYLTERLDKLGGPESYNHYAVGWGHAMNAPYQWTKQVASHWGGTRNGAVVHWPNGIKAKGEIRSQFHHVIAQLLRAMLRCGEAILEYEAVLASDRNFVAALANIGRCKIYVGPIEEAIPLHEQAIRLSPRDPNLGLWYFRIGQAYLLQSRIDEAILALEKAHSASPTYPFVSRWLAAAYGLEGDFKRVAVELGEARRLSGNGFPASTAQVRSFDGIYIVAPNIHAMYEATYSVGLRKAGVPEK